MDILSKVIKTFFGTKSDKDRKEIQPYVDRILALYPQIDALSNDELRARSAALRRDIAEEIRPDEERITELKGILEQPETSLEDKERHSREIDKLTKDIDDKIEKKLDEILPEAFAIMKSTARRFAENPTIEVTATQFDRDLAATKDFVTIEGDKAVYSNSWVAGGNTVTWDMVHYDVQLFGGVVLHKGRIAEMATGEGKTLVATLPVFLNALAGKGVHVVTVNDYLARRDSEWMGPMYEFHGLSVDCIDNHQPNSAARRKAYLADIPFGTNNEFGFDYLRDNMAIQPQDLVQRKHHFAIVDEVDSVLIDDARTPLIISGPVPKGDDQLFDQYRGFIEQLYNVQRNFVNDLLGRARKLIGEGKNDEGGVLLYRAHKGLPKYKPLIKFLSEPGNKALMQKVENTYMQDNNRRMPEITDELFFVIDEKLNSVELTDKGHEFLARNVGEEGFFVLPDIGAAVAEIEKSDLSAEEKTAKKDELINEYAVKSERVHTINQLLKAYSMFEKDVEYVVIDNKVKIVDEQTGRIMEGRRYSDGLHQAIEAKERVKVEAATQTFATITLQNYFRMYHKLAGMTGTAETEASEFWSIYKLDVVVIPTNRPVIREDRDDKIYKTKREKYNAVVEEIVSLVAEGRPVLVGTTSVEVSELLSRVLKLRGIKHNVLNAKHHQQEAQVVAEAGRAGQVTIATNMAGRGTDIKLTPEVKEAGGLAIVGTERHESRRVDRQLRGRAGRQGDPGASRFYLSLEDDLMRLFGGDRVSGLMDTLKIDEDTPIENRMITNTLESAQKKLEGRNFEIRKNVLKYDDVMNQQREIIYGQRRKVLDGEDISAEMHNMLRENIDSSCGQFLAGDVKDDWDFGALRRHYQGWLTTDEDFHYTVADFDDISRQGIADQLYDRGMKILADKEQRYGAPVMRELERICLLKCVDRQWMDHIDNMDQLRQGIALRGYGQKDPVVEYRIEGFDMFDQMVDSIRESSIKMLLTIEIRQAGAAPKREQVAKPTGEGFVPGNGAPGAKGAPHGQPVRVIKIGRNDPCPCGSGLKWKKCTCAKYHPDGANTGEN